MPVAIGEVLQAKITVLEQVDMAEIAGARATSCPDRDTIPYYCYRSAEAIVVCWCRVEVSFQ